MDWTTILQTVATACLPVALGLAWTALGELQRRGYQITYATAVLRAVGAGQQAATAAGVSMFTTAGRKLAVEAGARYLMEHVGEAGAKLGIEGFEAHAVRVNSQIGVLAATAAASATASSVAPADSVSLMKGPRL